MSLQCIELEKERDALKAENERLKAYRDAIDEALIVRHLGVAKDQPALELHEIVNYDIDICKYFNKEENERLREVLRCAWHLRENQALCYSPEQEDEERYQAVWDALDAAIDAAKESKQ